MTCLDTKENRIKASVSLEVVVNVTMTTRLLHLQLVFILACDVTRVTCVEPHTSHVTSPLSISNARGPVFISEPPATVKFVSTQGALVPCTAYGRPAPAMDWIMANGSDVIQVPGLIEVLANNSLYFHPFSEEDFRVDIHTGSYRCMASNSAGVVVSRKVSIKTVLLSRYRTYNVRVNDIYVTRGGTAVFRCAINPYYVRDHVQVTSWTRNSHTIKPDERISVLSSGELLIRQVATPDSYVQFRCVTTNNLTGEQKISDPATTYVIDPVNSAPSVLELPTLVQVVQGQTAELPCVAGAYPLPEYTWSKDGVIISPDQARVRQKGGNLIIVTSLARDSGRYMCTVSNPLGTKTVFVTLIVTAPLSAYIEPSQQTVDVGEAALLNCTVYGHPIEGVQWYKDGRPLTSNNRVSMLTEHSLRILNVQREDRGMYQCLAWNKHDNIQATGQLSLGVAKPHIYRGFVDKTVTEGPEVSLQCVVSGNPTPIIHWTLDDGLLPASRRYSIGSNVTKDGDVISYVNITNVQIKDGGEYKCSAVNSAGSAQHVGRLNVYGLPYIKPLSNLTAVAHQMLVIKCYVSGFPIHVITWSKDHTLLPVNHRQHVSSDGILTIHNVSRTHDQGVYTCDARNNGGQGMSRDVYITVMEPPKIDRFQFPERKQGDRVSVTCVVSSGDLPLSVKWIRNGKTIDPDTGIRIQKLDSYSSTLSINEASPTHSGNYTCVASNQVATVNYTATLHVYLPPSWITEPADSYVVLGSSVTLDCQATGDPKPDIVWKKSAGSVPGSYRPVDELESDYVSRRTVELANGSLIINNARITDNGYYLCQATNGIGSGLGKVVFLTVHVPAKFEKRDQNFTIHLGDDITINCVVNGDRPLSVSWSFNGKSLDWYKQDRLDVSSVNTDTGRKTQLTIHKVHRNDSGFYVCNAKNMFGRDSLTTYLKVLERPDPPRQLSVVNGDSRSVTVSWKPGYNGNVPITAYILQAKLHQATWYDVTNTNITVAGSVHEATIFNLHPNYKYIIRIMSVNSVGLSDPSQDLSYTTHPEAPSGPPEDVVAMATGSQSLVVTWKAPAPQQQNGRILGYYVGYKIHNASAPYMYLTKAVEQLKTTNQSFVTEDGKSSIFVESSHEDERFIMSIEGLDKFTQYSIHVQAYNEMGAGPRSEDVVVFTLEDVPSQPPQNVQATPISSQSIMITWAPPALYTLHGILQGYKVFYKQVKDNEDESDSASMTTTKLSAAIFGLEKYTNYSLQVLAYTRKGEGVRSDPVYVRTQPDLPGRPADIRAVPAGPNSVFVMWKRPLHTNGELMKYTLYMRDLTEPQNKEQKIDLPSSHMSYLVSNLSTNHKYSFSVSANTMVGNGERTYEVLVSTVTKVTARIASFPSQIYTYWHSDVILECISVGDPAPVITWRKRSEPITFDDKFELMSNGSLLIRHVEGSDAANYTCRAENQYGADEITIALTVQAPPKQPVVTIAATTSSAIQVNWRSGSNGGSRIQGFIVSYKRTHGTWQSEKVGQSVRSYTASGLRCGTEYRFKVQAYNKVGKGISSDVITTRTNGSTPIMPAQSLILTEINSTWIVLDLSTWQTGGCPVTFYDVSYQYWGDSVWHKVDTHIDPKQIMYRVDLRPATWYKVKVMAHNEAGSTECLLKFSTKTYEGNTIEPVDVVHRYSSPLYQRAPLILSLCAACVFSVVCLVGIVLYCKRRQRDYQYKDEEGNIKPYTTFPKQIKPLNNEKTAADSNQQSVIEFDDPDLDKLPPPPTEMLYSSISDRKPSHQQDTQRQSGTSEELSDDDKHISFCDTEIKQIQQLPKPTRKQTKRRPTPPTPPPRRTKSDEDKSVGGHTAAPPDDQNTASNQYSTGVSTCKPTASVQRDSVSSKSPEHTPILLEERRQTLDRYKSDVMAREEESQPLVEKDARTLDADEGRSTRISRLHKRYDKNNENEDMCYPLREDNAGDL